MWYIRNPRTKPNKDNQNVLANTYRVSHNICNECR